MDHSCGKQGKANMLKDGKFFRQVIREKYFIIHFRLPSTSFISPESGKDDKLFIFKFLSYESNF